MLKRSFFILFFFFFSVALADFDVDSIQISNDLDFSWESEDITNVDLYLLHPSKKVFPLVDFQKATFLKQKAYNVSRFYFNVPGQYSLLAYDQAGDLIVSKDFAVLSKDIGGNVEVDQQHFEFVDLPLSVKVLEEVSFSLRSLDLTGELDPSYLGTVRFEVEGDFNAELPTDYEFIDSDVVEHLFSSGLMFSTKGLHTLKVFDINDDTLVAEAEVSVIEKQEDSDAEVLLEITQPSFDFSDSSQIQFVGKTNAGLDVQLFENDVLLETYQADSEGNFDFLSPALADGDYKFNLVVNGVKSTDKNVKIKTQTLNLESFEIAKLDLIPSEMFEFNGSLSDLASSASIVINGIKTPLIVDDTALSGQVSAPLLPGEYEVLILVQDEFLKTTTFKLDKKIKVSLGSESSSEDSVDSFINDIEFSDEVILDPNFETPSAISDLTLDVADKTVTLKFNHAKDDSGIAFYEILYGQAQDNLNVKIDTNGPVNEWFIPNLVNDVEYFFQVQAIDLDGNVGEASPVVSAIAGRPNSTSMYGTASTNAYAASDVGPDLWIAICLAMVVAFYARIKYFLLKVYHFFAS